MILNDVAVLVINSSVLKGGVTNGHYLNFLNELYLFGIDVKKFSIISDCVDLIKNELIQDLNQFTYIFLLNDSDENNIHSIYKNVARIFKQDLVHNGQVLATENVNCTVSLQHIPAYSKLIHSKNPNEKSLKLQPILYTQRLFIVNHNKTDLDLILKNSLKPIIDIIVSPKIYQKEFLITSSDSLHSALEDVKNKFSVCTTYEKSNNNFVVKLNSVDLHNIIYAECFLRSVLMEDVLYTEESNTKSSHAYSQIQYFMHTQQSVSFIEECFSKYGPENVILSFNGGKDCTVLLHMVLVVLKAKYPNYRKPIKCLYVRAQNPFKEVEDFIQQVEKYYNLKICACNDTIKNSLANVLEEQKNLKACLMGTRRTDPYSQDLQIFQMTDPGWPQIMRVSPLLDWHYSDIWDYLLFYKVPYCTLYDEGYTSLGNTDNTFPNPDLCINGSKKYLQAYKLLDGSKEREGRHSRIQKVNKL